MKLLLLLAVVAFMIVQLALALQDENDENQFYFIVSQIHNDQEWCFGVPESIGWPPNFNDGRNTELEFNLCDQYYDQYHTPLQSWKLDTITGRLLSYEYIYDFPNVCVVVNDGLSLGDGILHFVNCSKLPNDKYSTFIYDTNTKQLKLKEFQDYCVTNRGITPDVGDKMIVKECTNTSRFQFKLQPAVRHWQILADGDCQTLCLMSEFPINPKTGDKIILQDCTSDSSDAHRYERIPNSEAILIHSRQFNSLCLQAGLLPNSIPKHGTPIVLWPCDITNKLQRILQIYNTENEEDHNYGYYKMTLEQYPNLCLTYHGGNCLPGDNVMLKNCNDANAQVDIWYDDEG